MSDLVRAGDLDREEVARRLGDHLAAGRLALAEYEERVTAAYRARTLGDLRPLLTDLPEQARTRPARRPRVPVNWALTAAVCLLIWAATSIAHGRPLYFWPGWVIGPWGAMIALRGYGSRHRAGRSTGQRER